MPLPIGELAALGAASCWTVSSIAFSVAGKRMGSLSLNLVRLVIAFVILTVYCGIVRGMVLPFDATGHAWGWLLASGLVGFVFGDICLFRAFVLIGPRLTMLIVATSPLIAALVGFVLLDERISLRGIGGMAVTLAGISWVVSESPNGNPTTHTTTSKEDMRNGLLLAFGGSVGQGAGMVLSKIGMVGNYNPFAAGQIRIIAGMIGFAAIFTAIGWWKKTAEGIRDRKAMGLASLGAFIGPFVGVTFSLVSVQHTQTGIAVTIMATTPVLLIPATILIHKERVSIRAIIGTVITVGGIAMLVLR